MSAIGYRKQGENTPLYNPERDFAYVTPSLLVTAIEKMELDQSPELAAWREQNEILPAEIAAVSGALANAQRDFVNSADPVNSFDAALKRHGFFDQRFVARQHLFSTIGAVFCAAWFQAVREVSIVAEPSPAQTDMARFASAVRQFVVTTTQPNYDAAELDKLMAANLQLTHDVLIAQLQRMSDALQRASARVAELEAQSAAPTTRGWLAWLRGLFSSRK